MRKGGGFNRNYVPQLKLQLTKERWWLKYTVYEEGYIKDDQQSKISSGQKEWVEK